MANIEDWPEQTEQQTEQERRKDHRRICMVLFLLGLALVLFVWIVWSDKKELSRKKNVKQEVEKENQVKRRVTERPVIAIDAGHGGYDPGKVGVNGTKEKDINLAIAQKIEQLLKDDYCVVMTRKQDESLNQSQSGNRKVEDMQERIRRMQEKNPRLAISIHQNSFPAQSVRGAQVFYYADSERGAQYAELMQNTLRKQLADGNNRKAKANRDYYMLRKTSCPFLIIECGFLSNPEEEAKLCDENYQNLLAKAIVKGIQEVLEDNRRSTT